MNRILGPIIGLYHRYRRLLIHLFAATGNILLILLTGQNPRVLLYALVIAMFYRLWLVALVCRTLRGSSVASYIIERCRKPIRSDGGYRRDMTDEIPFLTTIYSLIIAATLALLITGMYFLQGPELLQPHTLATELFLASLLAVVFLWDDLYGQQIVVDDNVITSVNLGYNTVPIKFMLIAVVVSYFVAITFLQFYYVTLGTSGNMSQSPWVAWMVLGVLVLMKLAFQLRIDGYLKDGQFL